MVRNVGLYKKFNEVSSAKPAQIEIHENELDLTNTFSTFAVARKQ